MEEKSCAADDQDQTTDGEVAVKPKNQALDEEVIDPFVHFEDEKDVHQEMGNQLVYEKMANVCLMCM